MSEEQLGIGDVVTSLHRPVYGTGIIVDHDGNRTAPLRVLFDDDYDDWFHPLELRSVSVVAAA